MIRVVSALFRSLQNRRRAVFIVLAWTLVLHVRADNDLPPTDFAAADVNIGERLFLETRFAQSYFAQAGDDANLDVAGDPVMALLQTTGRPVPGPFAGQAMNCRQCHIVDEEGYGEFGNHKLGNRTYSDFARRSPLPLRDDGRTLTPRNSPGLVDALLPHPGPLLLHLDGQFASVHDLIIATLTGRNYGWLPSEYPVAVHHIASIIRNDNGMGYLATEARDSRFEAGYPGKTAYRNVFSGFTDYNGSYLYDPRTLIDDLISPKYRLNMRDPNTSDEDILNAVANLIEAYLRNLVFSQATNGVDFVGVGTPIFNGSPYDVFLIKNGLPQLPDDDETSAQYARRLLALVNQLPHPQYVINHVDGDFSTHEQAFQFGPKELAGMKIFFTDTNTTPPKQRGRTGNCVACHTPPAFTDFIFHNTGAAEEEYDAIHGAKSFQKIFVPGLAERQTNYDAWLPPTPNHPQAIGWFETPPTKKQPGAVDLGLWNVFANPDFPAPQAGLRQILPQLLGIPVPHIAGIVRRDGRLIISGTNGAPGGTYYVFASASLQLPMTNWTVVATNTFDPQGDFSFTNTIAVVGDRGFYYVSPALPTDIEVLPLTIARFKTPTLRDLGQSNPYLHTGRMNTIGNVIQFYRNFSGKARNGNARNIDPEIRNISLDDDAVGPLKAFLNSLNEDYTD
jgi:cytochrome c peroxidase